MPPLPPRPILGWKAIAEKARVFAREYGLAQRSFPLDVEEITEFDLGMEIRLCAGVLEELGSPAQARIRKSDQWKLLVDKLHGNAL